MYIAFISKRRSEDEKQINIVLVSLTEIIISMHSV